MMHGPINIRLLFFLRANRSIRLSWSHGVPTYFLNNFNKYQIFVRRLYRPPPPPPLHTIFLLSTKDISPQANYVFAFIPSYHAIRGPSCHSTPVGDICAIRSELLQLAALVFCYCCVIGRIVTPLWSVWRLVSQRFYRENINTGTHLVSVNNRTPSLWRYVPINFTIKWVTCH